MMPSQNTAPSIAPISGTSSPQYNGLAATNGVGGSVPPPARMSNPPSVLKPPLQPPLAYRPPQQQQLAPQQPPPFRPSSHAVTNGTSAIASRPSLAVPPNKTSVPIVRPSVPPQTPSTFTFPTTKPLAPPSMPPIAPPISSNTPMTSSVGSVFGSNTNNTTTNSVPSLPVGGPPGPTYNSFTSNAATHSSIPPRYGFSSNSSLTQSSSAALRPTVVPPSNGSSWNNANLSSTQFRPPSTSDKPVSNTVFAPPLRPPVSQPVLLPPSSQSFQPPTSSSQPPHIPMSQLSLGQSTVSHPRVAPPPVAPPLAPPPLTQPSFPPPPTSYPGAPQSHSIPNYHQQQQQVHGQQQANVPSYQPNVTRDGWNKAWGTDNVDLLQHRNVLPPEGPKPPQPVLAQDFLRNCTPDLLRCTFTKIPETKSLLQKVKMPFGILIHPFKDLEQLPVVSCQQIVRCRACRTYINPFVLFRGDRRWECNLCYKVNELPDEFQYDPVSQTYGDPSRRPEVREATIEYIAPSEYMLGPPQPAVYLWLLDTSRQAVDTGYLKVMCDILLEQLANIPGDKRALLGFMTFSATVQFYLMPDGCDSVNMLEVGDLDDIFVPHPDDLLVNLHQQQEQLTKLLSTLPETHANTLHTQSALGPALTAAFKLLSPLGGRITVMTSMLPNLGPGSLKAREDPNQRAATDVLHLTPATDFYKKLALDCSGQQIAVDLFTLNSQYIDLATLSGVSKFSGGSVHHFPNFHVHLNPPSVAPFVACLTRYVTRKIGFEAVMRIRATRGLAITNFHGHFFVRSPDLLSLPNINPDAGFAMQVCIEEPLHNLRSVSFQAALLYTSSRGERRIRVHTLCIPVTGNLHDVVNSADQQAAVAILARMAVDRCQSSTSTDARDALVNACIDALTSYRNSLTQSPGRALVAPHNLKLWPMYTLGLLKSISFRVGLSTKLDDRVFAMTELKTMPTKALIASIYPDLYPIHLLNEQGALNIDDEVIPQPPRIQLSAEYINQDGAYLADTGSRMVVYIRAGICQRWLQDVLDVAHFDALPHIIHQLPELDNCQSRLLNVFIKHLNSSRPYQSPIVIIREDSPARSQFVQLLIEDRTEGNKSYVEFVQFLAGSVK